MKSKRNLPSGIQLTLTTSPFGPKSLSCLNLLLMRRILDLIHPSGQDCRWPCPNGNDFHAFLTRLAYLLLTIPLLLASAANNIQVYFSPDGGYASAAISRSIRSAQRTARPTRRSLAMIRRRSLSHQSAQKTDVQQCHWQRRRGAQLITRIHPARPGQLPVSAFLLSPEN